MFYITNDELEQIEELCKLQCTLKEVRDFLKFSEEKMKWLIANNLDVIETIDSARAIGTMSIRRKQFEIMNTGNPQMAIHLGKNYCGQSDKMEQVTDLNINGGEPVSINIGFVKSDNADAD